MSGASYTFEAVQDYGGFDCGVVVPEKSLEKTLHWKDRYTLQTTAFIENGIEVKRNFHVAVCKVKIEQPPMEVFTLVQGLDRDEPLLGRFMIHDVSTRVYVGHLGTIPEVLIGLVTFRKLQS